MRKLSITHESWPIAGGFTISRGTKTTADVVVVTIEERGVTGRGECVPYSRYNETVAGTIQALETARPAIERGAGHGELPSLITPKAARNALDCALWDFEAKTAGKPVWELAGTGKPRPLITAYTLSLDTPERMAKAAARSADRPLLKLKLGRDGDEDRLRRVRAAAPKTRLIVDANEAWSPDKLASMLDVCAETGVELVEQPLPAGSDEALATFQHNVPVCADESAHDSAGLAQLAGKYDAVNIKLDKAGGLTEALAMAAQARSRDFKIMVGCMLATSLSMAPAMLVAQSADFVDLDGPLLLEHDRQPGIRFDGSVIHPPAAALWG